MKTTKTTTIMSKVLCASALMLPLALPVVTQAQGLPDKTVMFQVTVNGTPCQNATYWGYTGAANSDNIRYLQLNDGDGDGVYTGTSIPFSQGSKLGVRLLEGTGVQPDPSPWPGSPATDFPGDPSRTIADFGTEHQDGFTYLTLNDNFLAATTVDGCAAAPAPAAPAANPSEVVATFLYAVQQGTSESDYSAYLSTALEQRVANGEPVPTLLGIQNVFRDFNLSNYDVDAAGRATMTALLNYDSSGPAQPTFTLVQENGTWQIDTIVAQQAPVPGATLAPAADPSAVVAAFLGAVQQEPTHPVNEAIDYSAYLSTALEQRLVNGEPIATLLGIQNYPSDFTVNAATGDGAGRATVTATLDGLNQRTFTLVREGGAWQIERIVLAETGTPALTLTETVIGFLTAVQQNPTNPAISQYLGTGRLNERLSNGETVASVLGIQNVYGTFSIDSVTLESPGNATVVATLNFLEGAVQRTFKVSQGSTWGIRDIVIDQAQPAPSASAAPSTAPSATAAPSTAAPATAKPAATAKPSVVATASAAPSSAPSKLPDTGAADTLLGGLVAAGAALAASGGYLLRRRAR